MIPFLSRIARKTRSAASISDRPGNRNADLFALLGCLALSYPVYLAARWAIESTGILPIAIILLAAVALAPSRWKPWLGLVAAIAGTLSTRWFFSLAIRHRFPPWQEFLFPVLILAGIWHLARRFESKFRLVAAAAVVAVCAFSANGIQTLFERRQRAELLAQAQAAPIQDHGRIFFQRGVNFTSEGRSARYGSPESIRTLRELHASGVDSIALVPYGFSRATEPKIRFGNPSMEPDDGIAIVAGIAHELGMKVLLKPQMWVQPGGFPGAVKMKDAAAARKWFEQYTGFVEYYAKLAQKIHADLFCIGTEFVHMSTYTDEWRQQAAVARKLYSGPLVYAATQGEEFEQLQFWDAVDYIGLNSYYPLPDNFSTTELIRKVEAVQTKFQKPVLLTEAGFVSMEWPNRQPWDETPRKLSMQHQAQAYEALFRAFWDKPWFQGFYWWRVGSNGEGGIEDGRHTPWRKPAMDVVSRYYKSARTPHSGQAINDAMR